MRCSPTALQPLSGRRGFWETGWFSTGVAASAPSHSCPERLVSARNHDNARTHRRRATAGLLSHTTKIAPACASRPLETRTSQSHAPKWASSYKSAHKSSSMLLPRLSKLALARLRTDTCHSANQSWRKRPCKARSCRKECRASNYFVQQWLVYMAAQAFPQHEHENAALSSMAVQ